MFKDYCFEICKINGIDTYIFSDDGCSDFLTDELLCSTALADEMKKYLQYTDGKHIFAAIAHHAFWRGISEWIPVLCMKYNDEYIHVHCTDKWVCVSCGYVHKGKMIMPIQEHEPLFYSGTQMQYPPCPSSFVPIKCSNCGKIIHEHIFSENNCKG